jgi:hypothetical protein
MQLIEPNTLSGLECYALRIAVEPEYSQAPLSFREEQLGCSFGTWIWLMIKELRLKRKKRIRYIALRGSPSLNVIDRNKSVRFIEFGSAAKQGSNLAPTNVRSSTKTPFRSECQQCRERNASNLSHLQRP